MNVPDICSFTTTFSTHGAVPSRRLMSSTRACSVSAPISPTGIVVAIALALLGASYYILHPVRRGRERRRETSMTDHPTRTRHDDVREPGAPRRMPLRTILLVTLIIAVVLSAAHAAPPAA